jgi:hypothetical protein
MPVVFVKTFCRKSHITRHQLIQSGQCPYALMVVKKLSVICLKLRDTNLYIVASVLMPVMFVKIHSVRSLKLRDTNLYIMASALIPVTFVKYIQ